MAIIMADNNFLIGLVDDREQHQYFIQEFSKQNAKIGLPTPVLAEFLVRDDNANRTTFLTQTNNLVQLFNFDHKSAIISAKIMRELLAADFFKNKSKDKQIVKVDIQILAITLANDIDKLFSTDKEMAKIIQLLNLPVEILDFKHSTGLAQSDLFA